MKKIPSKQKPNSNSEENTVELKMPFVVKVKKEQTVEQAIIRLTKVEHADQSKLIERIENEEKTNQQETDSDEV